MADGSGWGGAPPGNTWSTQPGPYGAPPATLPARDEFGNPLALPSTSTRDGNNSSAATPSTANTRDEFGNPIALPSLVSPSVSGLVGGAGGVPGGAGHASRQLGHAIPAYHTGGVHLQGPGGHSIPAAAAPYVGSPLNHAAHLNQGAPFVGSPLEAHRDGALMGHPLAHLPSSGIGGIGNASGVVGVGVSIGGAVGGGLGGTGNLGGLGPMGAW